MTVYVDSDAYLDEVSYAAGEDITVRYGAKLTIRKSNSLVAGRVHADAAEIIIDSFATGAVTPIVHTTTDNNTGAITCTGAGKVTARGGWYQLGVGDGTANQTFTFYHTQGRVPWVQVETGSGTDEWIDCVNLDGHGLSLAGAGNIFGRFFDYDEATGVITFGDGVNGIVVPNGAKVRCPDIFLTGEGAASTYGSRADFNTSYVGSWDLDTMMCSDRIYVAAMRGKNPLITDVGIYGQCEINGVVGGTFDRLIIAPDPTVSNQLTINCKDTVGLTFINCVAVAVVEDTIRGDALRNVTFTDCTFYVLNRSSWSYEAFYATDSSDVTLNNFIAVGGRVNINGSADCTVNDMQYSDTLTGATTTITGECFYTTLCSNLTLDGLTKVPGGTPPYSNIANMSSGTNAKFLNINFDCEGHTGVGIYCPNVTGLVAAYCNFGNIRTTLLNTYGVVASSIKFFDILCSSGGSSGLKYVGRNVRVEGVAYDDWSTSFSGGFDMAWCLFYNPASTITTGSIYVPFVQEYSFSNIEYTAGTPYHDNIDVIHMPNAGDQVVFTIPNLILGVSSFQNVDFIFTGYYQAYNTFEYQIKSASGSWSDWKDLTATNISGETISATDGFYLKFRVTAVTTNLGNTLSGIEIPVNVDPTVKRPYAYLTMTVSGIPTGSQLLIHDLDNADPQHLGTELYSNDNTTGDTVDFTYLADKANDDIIISLYANGYRPIQTKVTLAGNDFPLSIDSLLQPETN